MRLMNERCQIKMVVEQWKKQYSQNPSKNSYKKIYEDLCALDTEKATSEDVAEIMGNSSWVQPYCCGECMTKSWNIVEIGELLDHESLTTYLCLDCLKKAVCMLENK